MDDMTINDPKWGEQASAELRDPPMPAFTWAQLERQLVDLATKPHTTDLVRQLLWSIRSQARSKPPELVLREVLCLGWIVLDEDICQPN